MTKTEKAQMAELLLAVGVLKGQLAQAAAAAAAAPEAVALKPQPQAAGAAWLPSLEAMSYNRPVIAHFVDDDESVKPWTTAFAARAAFAADPERVAMLRAALGFTSPTPQPVALGKPFRAPNGLPMRALY